MYYNLLSNGGFLAIHHGFNYKLIHILPFVDHMLDVHCPCLTHIWLPKMKNIVIEIVI